MTGSDERTTEPDDGDERRCGPDGDGGLTESDGGDERPSVTVRGTRRRDLLAAVGATATGALAGCANVVGELRGGGDGPIVVATDGADYNPGSSGAPLGSIQTALERAQPGDTIELEPGEYREALTTVRDGEEGAPITITGPPEAVIRPPPGSNDALKVEHHHVHLRGTTIDGLLEPDRKFETYEAWVDRCVFLTPVGRREEGVEYLRGLVIEPAKIGNSARAMIQTFRIRDASIGNFEVIGPAGMQFDRRVEDFEPGHVREIVYVGNAEAARGEPYYEYETLDRSRNVRIHHVDNSTGYEHNELVDVKLGSSDVTIEYCTDRNASHTTEDDVYAAIQLNGNDCTVRWNDIGSCALPFSFAPWTPTGDVDGADWSLNNAIYGNYVHDFVTGPFRVLDDPRGDVGPVSLADQGPICGNRIEPGSPPTERWLIDPNGFDGTVADERGREEVTVAVVEGPDGYAFDPPVLVVDRGTTLRWEWGADDGTHYVVRAGREHADPASVPDPVPGPNAQTRRFDFVGLHRYVCFAHHDEGLRGALIVDDDRERWAFATEDCDDVPDGDGIGHTGGQAGE